MSNYPYIIIDDNPDSALETQGMASRYGALVFVGSAHNYEDGINLVLEHQPKLVFLEIDPEDTSSNLSLALINELYRYLKVVPEFIITTKGKALAYEAIRHDVADYLIKPLEVSEFRKAILKFDKKHFTLGHVTTVKEQITTIPSDNNPTESITVATREMESKDAEIILPMVEFPAVDTAFQTQPVAEEDKPLIICVKSYGDYRFINANDICYLQADNNSTDIHLNNGEMITAFKTLKHFETVLNSPFVRIHNSYIVNIDYVSRIHTGNAVCYIKNTTTKLPFSKSYKENVDAILNSITKGNYLEI